MGPDCIVVVVTFGAEVCVHTDLGNRSVVARRAHDSEADLVAKGQDLGMACSEKVGTVAERLGSTVAGLKPCGNTALGPGLAVSVGLAGGRPGSKIVLCTDGMENLGTCADLTGGHVEMADLQALSTKFGSMLANATLATGLELVLISGAGVSVGGTSSSVQNGEACVAKRTVGTVTAATDLTFELDAVPDLAGKSGLLQLQLRYARADGEEVLQVCTVRPPVSSSREQAESDINGTCVALAGIHTAARRAQQGDYKTARVHLISTCRLIQRAMRTLAHQESYLSFIVQAEKLDGFMRERECQEQIFGADGSSQRGRDDDASRSMYQMKSLSVKELMSRV